MTKENGNPKPASLPAPPVAVSVIAAIAILIASYLLWHALNANSTLAGCGGEGAGCDEVLQTRWGSWFGIPVSAGGWLTYAAIFGLSILMRKQATRGQWSALLALSVLAASSALWFIGLQALVVKSYCWYCMTVHACGILTAILVLKNVPRTVEDTGKKKRPKVEAVTVKQRGLAAAAGVLGVAVLAGGQIYSGHVEVPQVTSPTPPPSSPQPVPVTQAPAAPGTAGDALLANGKIRFTMGDFPIFGSPDAKNIVAHFFDFTCPACREFHPSLMAAHQPSENATALVMIPVPLDATCNPTIRETSYGHQNACEYARIGLAVWSIRPDAYSMYDQFIFEGQYPPPAGAARGFADQLVGRDNLEAALANPKIMETLRHGLTMFYSPAFPNKALPALVTETNILVGIQPPPLLTSMFSGRSQ